MMSIWHNEPIPTEENKYVYVEFYTQIPYTERETESRCILLASDCVELEEPDLIRWCYLDDLLNQQAEIDRLREAIRLARDTAYQETQDCPRCGFIDDILTKALNGESEEK